MPQAAADPSPNEMTLSPPLVRPHRSSKACELGMLLARRSASQTGTATQTFWMFDHVVPLGHGLSFILVTVWVVVSSGARNDAQPLFRMTSTNRATVRMTMRFMAFSLRAGFFQRPVLPRPLVCAQSCQPSQKIGTDMTLHYSTFLGFCQALVQYTFKGYTCGQRLRYFS